MKRSACVLLASLALLLGSALPVRADGLAERVRGALERAAAVGVEGGIAGRMDDVARPDDFSEDPAVRREAREAADELEAVIVRLRRARRRMNAESSAALDPILDRCVSELRRVREVAGLDPDAPIEADATPSHRDAASSDRERDPASRPAGPTGGGGGLLGGGGGSGSGGSFTAGSGGSSGRGGSEDAEEGLSLPPRDPGDESDPESEDAEEEAAAATSALEEVREADESRPELPPRRRDRRADEERREDDEAREASPEEETAGGSREERSELGELLEEEAAEREGEAGDEADREPLVIHPGRIIVVRAGRTNEGIEAAAARVDEALLSAAMPDEYRPDVHEIWLVTLPQSGTPVRLELEGPSHVLERVGAAAGGTANLRGRVAGRTGLPDELGDVGTLHVEELVSIREGW